MVLEVVMLYFGCKTDWNSAKNEMSNGGAFLQRLKDLAAKENISKLKDS